MTRLSILFVPAVFTFVQASAAGQCTQKGAATLIRRSEFAWAESLASGDTRVARRILAENFVGVSPDGSLYNKRMATSGPPPGGFVSDRLQYVHVRFYDRTAVAQGSEKWKKRSGESGHFVWIDTWNCANGKWRIVGAADVAVVDKR